MEAVSGPYVHILAGACLVIATVADLELEERSFYEASPVPAGHGCRWEGTVARGKNLSVVLHLYVWTVNCLISVSSARLLKYGKILTIDLLF